MSQVPTEARDGLMRAWLKVLSDRHPNVTWVPASHNEVACNTEPVAAVQNLGELARSA